MSRIAVWVAATIALAGASAGCFRLSDPIFAFQDIHATEPSRDGKSLIIGTLVVDTWTSGDLNTISLKKLGPGAEHSYVGADRIGLFRVFFARKMKDGHFIIEVNPGVYQLDSFSTSGWGRQQIWNARDDARKSTRLVVTRPGVYDLGTIRVARGEAMTDGYTMERITESDPERQAIFARALAGTKWESLAAGAGGEGDAPAPDSSGRAGDE